MRGHLVHVKSRNNRISELARLRDAEDLSYEEIRGILRLPITTLKIRVVRGRAMLRELVERCGVT